MQLDIQNFTHDGRGVARVEGKAVFVTGALVGERVIAKLTAKHRQFDEAEVVEVLQASPDRVVPGCAHFGVCGGCALQHLAPAAQIAAKQQTLLDNLGRIGDVTPKRILEPLQGDAWGYRRRGRLSVRHVEKKGRVLVGFRETNGKFVADLQRCPVVLPAIGERLTAIAELLASMDAVREIPQIEFACGDALTVLVFRHLQPLSAGDLAKLQAFAQREQLAVMLQPKGPESLHALWPEQIELYFDIPRFDLRLDFDALDFIQVNAAINARMIDHALGLLAVQPDESILDLFCGLGNFTLPLARVAKSVVGVEGDHALVARARRNAERNGIGNAEFFMADLAENQRDAAWAKRHYDRVLLDPARAGADKLIEWFPFKQVKRVVYVSCHPASLARDAGLLVREHGFKLKAAGVMDMFPHTAHVESIAMFER
ncbi:MAG: 23S rRNA (uracil(1939)-C(5))-methyltransferase RlmD [Rhodanobacteraceae bacterium]|nr:23S rRNA (uracil(1939)-C(5))-methyltransferase RlmD [Rhodanobacteraceae bacterium]MBL0041396.1 23S rRNA (uracil(1939)-C(5))-methyltransferase RlmD [Xanthomonadales bacterium]